MKFSRIVFFSITLFYLGSCQNYVGKEHETAPQKNVAPSTDYQKTDEEIPAYDRQKPAEKPLKKEEKKAKLKKIDTLKPLVAIP